MSDLVFNDEVTATYGFPFKPRSTIESTQVRSAAGTQQSFLNSDHDKATYFLGFQSMTNSEKESLEDFFKARSGAHETFLFYDARTYDVASESIGTADGSTLTFQLTQDGFSRWNIVANSYTVWVDGATQTDTVDYNVDVTDDGRIIFVSAPASGAVTASYQYYRRVHFLEKDIDPYEVAYRFWNVDLLTLEEILVNV